MQEAQTRREWPRENERTKGALAERSKQNALVISGHAPHERASKRMNLHKRKRKSWRKRCKKDW